MAGAARLERPWLERPWLERPWLESGRGWKAAVAGKRPWLELERPWLPRLRHPLYGIRTPVTGVLILPMQPLIVHEKPSIFSYHHSSVPLKWSSSEKLPCRR